MARDDGGGPPEMSILDRLLDDDPSSSRDPRKSRAEAHQAFLDAVRRDLEAMLNTRPCGVSSDPALTQLNDSILNYGIATAGGTAYGVEANRERFRDQVEAAIRRFEPRFLRVSVDLLPDPEGIDRTIRFRVDALLDTRPAPEPLVFDSVLDPSTLGISVAAPRNV
jgi:type VI secretion system protein ImpF